MHIAMFVGVLYVYSCLLRYSMLRYSMYIAMFVEIQYVHSYVCWGAVCT